MRSFSATATRSRYNAGERVLRRVCSATGVCRKAAEGIPDEVWARAQAVRRTPQQRRRIVFRSEVEQMVAEREKRRGQTRIGPPRTACAISCWNGLAGGGYGRRAAVGETGEGIDVWQNDGDVRENRRRSSWICRRACGCTRGSGRATSAPSYCCTGCPATAPPGKASHSGWPRPDTPS